MSRMSPSEIMWIPLRAGSVSALPECWVLGSEHTESSLNPLKYQKAS